VLHGLDVDNGSEFINEIIVNYCQAGQIELTRSRAYRKNDQAHIEERNRSVVRRLVGYDRYDGEEACAAMNELYSVSRLHQNYFQPLLRLESKERDGGHVTKHYDRARTPLQRLLGSKILSDEQAVYQQSVFAALDPVRILDEQQELQDRFWRFAWNCAQIVSQAYSGSGAPASESLTVTSAASARSTLDMGPEFPPAKAAAETAAKAEPLRSPPECPAATIVPTQQMARTYRRTCKPISKPAYRAQDPTFVAVWDEIDQTLHANPRLSVARILGRLQERYPGRFAQSKERTLYRRVHEWRAAHPEYNEQYFACGKYTERSSSSR
jgi:hypothetical protein